MTFDPIPGQADSLTCNVKDIPLDDRNLVIKVRSQQHCTGCPICSKTLSCLWLTFRAQHCNFTQHHQKRIQTRSLCALQALKLFRRHTGVQQFFQIHLDKTVPHGTTACLLMSMLLLLLHYLHTLQRSATLTGREQQVLHMLLCIMWLQSAPSCVHPHMTHVAISDKYAVVLCMRTELQLSVVSHSLPAWSGMADD